MVETARFVTSSLKSPCACGKKSRSRTKKRTRAETRTRHKLGQLKPVCSTAYVAPAPCQSKQTMQLQRQSLRGARGPTPAAAAAARRPRALCVVRALPSFDGVTSAYVGLSLAAASFLATFGLAPRFREAFKEDVAW
jgi:hypothetical protein